MSNKAKAVINDAKTDALFPYPAREELPQEARKADLLAELRRIQYDASIRKGFTPDQAYPVHGPWIHLTHGTPRPPNRSIPHADCQAGGVAQGVLGGRCRILATGWT